MELRFGVGIKAIFSVRVGIGPSRRIEVRVSVWTGIRKNN